MLKLRNVSIKRKLTTIITMASSLAILLISVVAFYIVRDTSRQGMLRNLSTLAGVLGANSTAALTFRDQNTAEEILGGLATDPGILVGYLYTGTGEVFASYESAEWRDIVNENKKTWQIEFEELKSFYHQKEQGHRFLGDHLDIVKPIYMKDKMIGTIAICASMRALKLKLRWFGIVMIFSTFLCLLLAYFFASKLQRIISEPILALAEKMELVSKKRNYTIQAEKISDDETGMLVEGFNDMIKQIRARDIELQKSNQDLKIASEAKSEFLANMSHELRTPLNHIIGFTSLVLDKDFGELNDIQKEYLNDVLNSSRHLLNLINDILDLSKIESGKMEADLSEVNIEGLLISSMTMVKEKAIKNNISLSLDTTDAPKFILADERKIKQVIYNLLSNAVKFTSTGGVIDIHTQIIDRSYLQSHVPEMFKEELRSVLSGNCASYLKVSVSDTGIGIKPDAVKLVFNAFQQEDLTITRKYGGTGLGLSLCRQLIELHGGGMWVESQLGEGSTFSFVLPIPDMVFDPKTSEQENRMPRDIEASSERVPGQVMADDGKESAEEPDGDKTVLVVEDNELNMKLVRKLLRDGGYTVLEATDAEKGLELISQHCLDLILMDIQLPGMDGLSAVKIIKNDQQFKHIPVLALTAYAMKGDEGKALDAGCDGYIPKPIQVKSFIARINKVLNTAQSIHQTGLSSGK